jgi:cytochrome b561
MAESTGYTRAQIALHWAIAGLILVNWFLGEGAEAAMEQVEEGATDVATGPHMWIGLLVLALVIVRLGVRVAAGVPQPPGVPGSLGVKLADWGHKLLYLLMIAVPAGGAAVWFGGMDTGEVHGLAANILMLVALGHAAMALVHQYVIKDGVLRRMMKAR